MVNKIIDRIAFAIYNAFGEDYEIYTESMEQGLTEPCFSILCLKHDEKRLLKNRYRMDNLFCIHYFPRKDNKNAECNDVAMRLFEILEYIDFEGMRIRGLKMEDEYIDGILHFYVNYEFYTVKFREIDNMEEHSIEINAKRSEENVYK